MKKLFIFLAFFAFSNFVVAQEREPQQQQPSNDQLQQQPSRETQIQLERAATVENRRKEMQEKKDEKSANRKKALDKRNATADTVGRPKRLAVPPRK